MIKNFILILFSVCVYLIGKGQSTYHPFPLVDGATWKVSWVDHNCLGEHLESYPVRYQYVISGDTTIQDTLYKKFKRGPLIFTPPYTCYPDAPNYGAIRQDTASRKVYFRPYY